MSSGRAGDLVEVYNDDGSTQAMVYPTPTAKKADLHAVRLSNGCAGQCRQRRHQRADLPNYKQTWADIRKLARRRRGVKHLSFKAQEYKVG